MPGAETTTNERPPSPVSSVADICVVRKGLRFGVPRELPISHDILPFERNPFKFIIIKLYDKKWQLFCAPANDDNWALPCTSSPWWPGWPVPDGVGGDSGERVASVVHSRLLCDENFIHFPTAASSGCNAGCGFTFPSIHHEHCHNTDLICVASPAPLHTYVACHARRVDISGGDVVAVVQSPAPNTHRTSFVPYKVPTHTVFIKFPSGGLMPHPPHDTPVGEWMPVLFVSLIEGEAPTKCRLPECSACRQRATLLFARMSVTTIRLAGKEH